MRGLEAERIRAKVRSRLFHTAETPVQVDRYLLERRIGEGGMGTVYRARDPQLMRDVAVKLLHSASTDDTLEEARAMAKLEHSHVLAIHDMGVHQGQVFLVMKYVDGQNLAGWLRSERRTPKEIARVFTAAAKGLAAAHRAGIVHRDFKPENVLIDRQGHVVVADFGLARDAPKSHAGPVAASPLTDIVGTPAYMAPELLEGNRATARSDQYAFCVALHEALHGVRPFPGRGIDELIAAQQRPRVKGDGSVPAWLDRIAARGLRVQPGERHASMDEVTRLLEGGPSRAPLSGAAAVAVLALAGTGWLLRPVETTAPSAAVPQKPPVVAPAPMTPPPVDTGSPPPTAQPPKPPEPRAPTEPVTFLDVLDEANVAIRKVGYRDCWPGDLSVQVAFQPTGRVRKVELEPARDGKGQSASDQQLDCLEKKFRALRISPFQLDEHVTDSAGASFNEKYDGAGPYLAPSSTTPVKTSRSFGDVQHDAYVMMKAVPHASCGYGEPFTAWLRFAETGEPFEVKVMYAEHATPEQLDCLRALFRPIRVKRFKRKHEADDTMVVRFN